MKFKLLKQYDSVYASHGITIDIKLEQWDDWEVFCRNIDSEIETRWDLAECRECWVISIEHLENYFKFVTRK